MKNKTILLKKAKRIVGDTLVFRDANTDDASFILGLRTDREKSRYLSRTSAELGQQIQWLQVYAKKTDEVYFIIENKIAEPLGTVRLYDPVGESFCWGSWILKSGCPKTSVVESALMVYAYAIDHLGFSQAHFDVRKGNKSVWRFHERFGAERIKETEQDYFYRLSKENIRAAQIRYLKYLPNPLSIET